MKRYLPVLPLLLIAVLSLLSAACGDGDGGNDDDDAGGVEETVRTVADAWNTGDVDRFLAQWTDEGLRAEFGVGVEEARQALPDAIGEPTITVRELSNTQVSGNTATTEARLGFGKVLQPRRYSLIKDGDAWKINGSEVLMAEVPGDVQTVNVEMDEFAFRFDAEAIDGGDVAFIAQNVGAQPHELILARIPEDLDIEQALRSPDPPEGIEFIAAGGPWGPNAGGSIVFIDALEAGRYIMVCFLPDTSDPQATPHAFKGMLAEFTID